MNKIEYEMFFNQVIDKKNITDNDFEKILNRKDLMKTHDYVLKILQKDVKFLIVLIKKIKIKNKKIDDETYYMLDEIIKKIANENATDATLIYNTLFFNICTKDARYLKLILITLIEKLSRKTNSLLNKQIIIGSIINNPKYEKIINQEDVYPLYLKMIKSDSVDDLEKSTITNSFKEEHKLKYIPDVMDVSIISYIYLTINKEIIDYNKNINIQSETIDFVKIFNFKNEITTINYEIKAIMTNNLVKLNNLSELKKDFPSVSSFLHKSIENDFLNLNENIFSVNNYNSFILLLVFVEKYLRLKLENNKINIIKMKESKEGTSSETKSLLHDIILQSYSHNLITKEEAFVFQYFLLKWKQAGLNFRNDYLHGFKGIDDYQKDHHLVNIFIKYCYGFFLKEEVLLKNR